MEDGAFALFCCPHPWGSWQLKSPRRQEFDIQGKNKIPEGGGGVNVLYLLFTSSVVVYH